jgi:glucosamine--fructose-6-phosphate aminotransferase (isomerizing)
MTDLTSLTPLLGPDSPLGPEAKDLIRDLFAREQALMAALPTDDPLDPKRRLRVDLTRPEIGEQPDCIRRTLSAGRDDLLLTAERLASSPLRRIVMTGCGDSLAVMAGMRSLMEEMTGLPCEPIQALDLAYYQSSTLGPDTLLIALSSSGTTTRTVEALMMAQARGAPLLALSNTPGSALMAQSDHRLTIHAERKGWPTQASTAAMALLAQLALNIGRLRGAARVDLLQAALDAVPDQIAEVIATQEGEIARLAAEDAGRAMYLFAGGGPSWAAAMFGAAKVKECTPDHAIAIPLEEFHHYNSQKAGDPMMLISPAGPSVPRACDTAAEGRRWGGRILSVVTGDETRLDADSHAVLRLPAVPEVLSALVYSLPLQLYAYHLAMAKFRAAEAMA